MYIYVYKYLHVGYIILGFLTMYCSAAVVDKKLPLLGKVIISILLLRKSKTLKNLDQKFKRKRSRNFRKKQVNYYLNEILFSLCKLPKEQTDSILESCAGGVECDPKPKHLFKVNWHLTRT